MIWIDTSISKSVAHAINLVRGDVSWVGDLYPQNTKDVVWLRDAGDRSMLVITRDKHIRTRPGERETIMRHQVGCFILNQKENPTKWGYLKLIVGALDAMQQRFSGMPRPFIFTVDSSGTLRRVA